jgi:tRNA dimethylallyltransferase
VDPGLADLAARGTIAILVGGTGLWLRAIVEGLDVDALPHDPVLRATLESDLLAHGLPALRARLVAEAPRLGATIDLANPRRVVRALEIALLRGDGPRPPNRGYDGPLLRLGLDVPDGALHRAWIAHRAEAQLDGGILPEAASLRARYAEDLPSFSAIGYREAWAFLDGRLDRAGYLAENIRRNVAFAKRQRTWFRTEPDYRWLDATAEPPLDARREALDAVRAWHATIKP